MDKAVNRKQRIRKRRLFARRMGWTYQFAAFWHKYVSKPIAKEIMRAMVKAIEEVIRGNVKFDAGGYVGGNP